MDNLYILGGQMWSSVRRKEEWQYFRQGIVMCIDTSRRQPEIAYEYVSPLKACPDLPSVVFKAGTLQGNHLYVCTQTEVLVYCVPHSSHKNYVSLPLFNDLHHVAPTDWETLLVAVTGLDLVVEIDLNGELVRQWDVLGGDTWTRFSRDVDYRKVPTTQPHRAHPNFVFMLGSEVWTTRCDLKDAVCLTDRTKRIDLSGAGFRPVEIVHDGVLHEGRLYFTAVDGNILIADPVTHRVTDVINLPEIVNADRPLGWCRGVKVLDDDRVVVGFTRLRRTKLREKVQWAKAQVKRVSGVGDYSESLPPLPTRISCFNLRRRELEWEVTLDSHGMDAVFSIL